MKFRSLFSCCALARPIQLSPESATPSASASVPGGAATGALNSDVLFDASVAVAVALPKIAIGIDQLPVPSADVCA